MKEWLRKIFAHMMSEGDNVTLCPVRILGAVMVGIYHLGASVGVATGKINLDMGALGEYVRQMIEFIGTIAASVGAKSLMRADAPRNPPPGQ
jgi:hypothetical protein